MTVESPPTAAAERAAPLPSDASADVPVMDGWESECDTERAKINIRGMAIVLLLGALLWIRAHVAVVRMSNRAVLGLAAAAVVMTVIEALYLWRPQSGAIPRWFKYVTVFGDMAFVSVLIYDTGGAQSPFFFVYFVFLISNCLRYGLLMSLFIALTVNVLYVIVLGLMPLEQRQASVLGGEGLKILAFWATALYGGSVSARLRRQASQLRVYEETLLDMRVQHRAELSAATQTPAAQNAPPLPDTASPKTTPAPTSSAPQPASTSADASGTNATTGKETA